MVSESASASHTLATEARELAAVAARFNIGETRPRRATAPAARPQPRLKIAGARGASAAASADWQEF